MHRVDASLALLSHVGNQPLGGILRSTMLLVGCSDHAVLNKSQPAYHDTIYICQKEILRNIFWLQSCFLGDEVLIP